MQPDKSELGKQSRYDTEYNPDKLFPIPRKANRDSIQVPEKLPFYGFDLWNHYEVSWLNEKGKPVVALAEIIYNCESLYLIESKSMKLYFNSFNNTKFKDAESLLALIKKDLEIRIGAPVSIKLTQINHTNELKLTPRFEGICLDDLDIDCSIYTTQPEFLKTEKEEVSEVLFSDLLKANCLVTNQPDWGSLQIIYKGKKINHEGLLRYIVSFRNTNEFAELCVERVFMDIMRQCKPKELTVYARFTRRGGLDINPYRSTLKSEAITDTRLVRQ